MSDVNKQDEAVLNDQETRKYLTPYAFGVEDSLLGLPLASPSKRFWAITIDAIIIGLLANISATFLGALVLIVSVVSLFKLRNQVGRRFAKFSFSFIAMISLLLLAVNSVDWQGELEKAGVDVKGVQKGMGSDALIYQNDSVSPEYKIAVSEFTNASGEVICPDSSQCDSAFFNQLLDDAALQGYTQDDAKSIFAGMKQSLEDNDRLTERMEDLDFESFLYESRLDSKGLGASSATSLVRWVNSLVNDVGLSIGWAALYFSVFIAWWEGQTVGKLLLGIRVIKISGKRLDLWESFERYAGYAAGFATGLLGFMQVIWDSNRQAIHDKISETVVIDLRKKSRPDK